MSETPPTFDPSAPRTDVVVVGAGLAGLAAARLARQAGLSVTVLDAQSAGGRGRTDERRGFLFNRGPHALYLGGHAHRVLSSLGVHPAGNPPATGGCGLRGDHIAVLPGGAASLLRTTLLGWRGKVAFGKLLGGLARVHTGGLASVTFAEWLDDQRLPTDARQLVEAVARVATYSNASDIVSADMVVGQIQLGMATGVRYVDGGWQTIVDALAAEVTVHRFPVAHIEHSGSDVVVSATHGERLVAKAVVLAVGTPAATATLLGRDPFDVGPPIEAACLDLGTSASAQPSLLLGLDTPLYLSDHGRSARLAERDSSVVHVARYLRPGEATEPRLQSAELLQLAARVGINEEQIVEHRYLHRLTVAGALPTAGLGGLPGRPAVTASGVGGVFLAGDWVGARGHLLDASLASAQEAVAAAVRLVRR